MVLQQYLSQCLYEEIAAPFIPLSLEKRKGCIGFYLEVP